MKDVEVHWGLGLALLLSLLLYILLVKAFPAREGPAAQSSSMPAAAAAEVPPVVPGLPLLGSALALGSGGAAFLETCRKKYGDAFTLRVAGQRMTFLFAPAALQRYFTAPDAELTFAPAVQQFTHRVFGLPPKHFYPRHLTMLQALRQELVPSALPRHNFSLLRLLLAQLAAWAPAGQLELSGALQRLVFHSSVALLFGPRFLGLPDDLAQPKPAADGGGEVSEDGCSSNGGGMRRADRLRQAFFAFEAGFELAASPVPHALQPRFLAARRRLLAALREAYLAGHFEGTVAGSLIEACGLPPQHVPNMLLAVLWASQANAAPSAFWALAFLLLPENAAQRQAVQAEAAAAAAQGGGEAAACSRTPTAAPAAGCGSSEASENGAEDRPPGGEGGSSSGRAGGPLLLSGAQQAGLAALAGQRRSAAAAAVAEALRLRSFSIDVRIAAADVALPCGDGGGGDGPAAVWVRKGDVVAISPYQSHLDPRLYQPSPEAYNPSREGMRLGRSCEAHAAVPGVGGVPGLSFGGGRYRCPGRYFAEAELALVTSLLLLLFDWQLLPRGGDGSSPGCTEQGPRSPASKQGYPGDPGGLLPPPDLRKLVGIKVPAGPCWVQYQRRTAPPS